MAVKKKASRKHSNYDKNYVELTPRNVNQNEYIKQLLDFRQFIVFGIGPAGTGKTLLAVKAAIKAFKDRKVDKIIITRPAVETDEKLGALPGTLEEKMDPFTRPIFDVFKEHFSNQEIQSMINESVIEISPLAYMRGRTFKNSYIIADEMQNATANQMKMLLTRLGENSNMAVTGDLAQADRSNDNGLIDFIKRLNKYPSTCLSIIQFDTYDIERHEAVAEVLRIYN